MVLKCPVCKSKNISLNTGGEIGKYQCNNCGYIGPLVIEADETNSRRS